MKSNENKFKRISSEQIVYLFEQMAVFINSGVATWESLYIIAKNAKKGKTKQLIEYLYNVVADGNNFSYALHQSGAFPNYVVGMVEVGENTGKMQEIYTTIHTYYRDKDKLKKSIKSSVTYPLVMAGMVLGVIFVLLVQVMPVFQQVFGQLGLGLNPLSTILLNVGEQLNTYSLYFVGLIIGIAVLYILLSLIPFGKKFLTALYDGFPLTSKMSHAQSLHRFAFAMSLMLSSGVDALSALDFSYLIVDSPSVKKKIQKVKSLMIQGDGLVESITECSMFAASFSGMIVAGVHSGAISEMLMSISVKYHDETQQQIQKILSIIEPTMVAILCLMVGLVMLSVMLPLTGILTGM